MMELLKICWKKLKLLYRNIKYWFILKFDKAVFTITICDSYFKKGDIISTKDNFYIVLKVINKGINYDIRVSRM